MFLIDQNLSRRLPHLLAGAFTRSEHVAGLGLEQRPDREVWQVAAERGLILLTKDRDFEFLALTLGPPPKVLIVALGNCTTSAVAELLLRHAEEIAEFSASEESLLVLGP